MAIAFEDADIEYQALLRRSRRLIRFVLSAAALPECLRYRREQRWGALGSLWRRRRRKQAQPAHD